MKKKYIYACLFLLIAIGIFMAIQKSKKDSNKPKEVEEQIADLHDITESVTASGKINAEEEVKISSDVSGEIVELNIKEGQYVEKGTLLAKIQPESYLALVEQAEAQYNNALANLKNMQANHSNTIARGRLAEAQFDNASLAYKRAKDLYAQKTISTADLEQAEMNYKTAKAEIEANKETIKAANFSVEAAQASVKGAQAAIKDAKSNLTKTSIFAPMSGIVSPLNVEKGEKVVGTLQMTGTEMMRISNFTNMEVRVDVSENEIIKVKIGDSANIEVDAYIGRKFQGIVTQVSNSSKGISNTNISSDQSTNFVVRIRILASSYSDLIEKGKRPFLPGMSATVDIFTQKERQVLALPIQAVVTREDSLSHQTLEVVFIDSNGLAIQRPVTTGIQDDTYIHIKSGISKGDKIITGPYEILSKVLTNKMNIQVSKEKK
ncbi:MAG: efflux RND transporter periplasmic adaptor subunit [Chitinophagales bacterium]|nr:efflux RND transporter periplasmic adaptor subunit [Chitinophagales bacterium]MCZ2394876.1 efflux RND transporter periplasmic adaptor subunit [Chitinophagales bacterium]